MGADRDQVTEATSMLITGRAYGRRATLEVTDSTIHWRAQRGYVQVVAENIATTTHDVRAVSWVEGRWSWAALSIIALSMIWMFTESRWFGIATLAFGIALLVFRWLRPRSFILLDLGTHGLSLRVDRTSATNARRLAQRIRRQLASGEVATTPSALP